MVINIKYYVIMSASIFLALGVGIFIGFSLGRPGDIRGTAAGTNNRAGAEVPGP